MTTDERDPREDKLPRWAQDKLADMRRRTRNAETERDEARLATDPAGSDAVLHPYDPIPIGLGERTQVQFRLGEGRTVLIYRDRDRPDRLHLMATGDSSAGSLLVHPVVSNVIEVSVT